MTDFASEYCVIVLTSEVKEVRKGLQELGLSDPTRRLKSNVKENTVTVPVDISDVKKLFVNDGDENNCRTLIYEYILKHMPGKIKSVEKIRLPIAKKLSIKKPEVKLKESLQKLLIETGNSWNEDIERDLPTHWEKHGDLLLLPLSSFINPVWEKLGKELWETVTSCMSCKRVARKDVISTNGYRTPQVHMLYGESSWVQHTDNGIKYTYDITKCMFSSGNITEKLRVAKFDCTNQIVVDLYAGIGYFTLPYLVYTNVKHLHACEWNPDAAKALRNNLVINRVQGRCTVHEGDNRTNCPKGIADRVNLGLIPSSKEGWPVACEALNPQSGGILHIHHNVNTKPTSISHGRQLEYADLPREAFRQEANICPDKIMGKQRLNHKNVNDNIVSLEKKGDNIETGIPHSYQPTGARMMGDNFDCNDQSLKKDMETVQNTVDRFSKSHDNVTLLQSSCDAESNKDFSHLYINNHQISSQEMTKCSSDGQIQNISMESKYSKWLPWAHEVSMEITSTLQDLHKTDWKTKILNVEHVKSYAPYVDHVVLDLECRPRNKQET